MTEIYRWTGLLSSRDAHKIEPNSLDTVAVGLDRVISALERRSALPTHYPSHQGATMTPRPFWVVEIATGRKRLASGLQDVYPQQAGVTGAYRVASSRVAQKVKGAGPSKVRWRNLRLEGDACPRYLYGMVSSKHVAPFVVLHRELAYLPAEPETSGDRLRIFNELAAKKQQQTSLPGDSSSACQLSLAEWVGGAQRLWSERKSDKNPDLCTQRLDYHAGLSRQGASEQRVVHTRSGVLRAAVLSDSVPSLYGTVIEEGLARYRRNGEIIDTQRFRLKGLIVDNLLHHITVGSEDEGYWLAALINSKPLRRRMPETDPYSAPSRFLQERNVTFHPEDSSHMQVSDLAREVEVRARACYLASLADKADLNALDDTDSSPPHPTLNYTSARKSWSHDSGLAEEIHRIDSLVEEIVEG
ncbi:MAG: hypothetical protein ACE5KH_05000 [Candidatus Geothermarchaeales archaeon]